MILFILDILFSLLNPLGVFSCHVMEYAPPPPAIILISADPIQRSRATNA